MPKLLEETQHLRKEQISNAAFRCFLKNGITRTSMSDIILESGISAGSIYSHFSSKEELLVFTMTGILNQFKNRITPDSSLESTELSPQEVMSKFCEEEISPPLAKLILQAWSESTRDKTLGNFAHQNYSKLLQTLQSAITPWGKRNFPESFVQEIHDHAELMMLLIQGLVARVAIDPTVDQQQLLKTILKSL